MARFGPPQNIGALLNAQAQSARTGVPVTQLVAQRAPMQAPPPVLEESSSEETIDLAYIVREKPKTKVVREFMRENLAAIQGDDEALFAP